VVEIKACAREPGHRTKIAVWSNDNNVDPVGACVGARGARVRQVVNELRGEKIDIVPFSDDPFEFVAKALSPAKVSQVLISDDATQADVIVPDHQLSLAIGREGQNARLAARLTGWRVDIKSETQLAEEESYRSEEWAQGEWVVDPQTGEQVWQPAEGGDAISAEAWAQGDPEAEAAAEEIVEAIVEAEVEAAVVEAVVEDAVEEAVVDAELDEEAVEAEEVAAAHAEDVAADADADAEEVAAGTVNAGADDVDADPEAVHDEATVESAIDAGEPPAGT